MTEDRCCPECHSALVDHCVEMECHWLKCVNERCGFVIDDNSGRMWSNRLKLEETRKGDGD